MKQFNLPLIAKSEEESLSAHIRHIRAAEYAIAGFTMVLGDFTAQSLKTNLKRPLEHLEQVYSFPEHYPFKPYDPDDIQRDTNHSWSEFGPSSIMLNQMARETALGYFSEHKPYDVYVVGKKLKLKKAETTDDIMTSQSFVVYPKGVQPPEDCLLQ